MVAEWVACLGARWRAAINVNKPGKASNRISQMQLLSRNFSLLFSQAALQVFMQLLVTNLRAGLSVTVVILGIITERYWCRAVRGGAGGMGKEGGSRGRVEAGGEWRQEGGGRGGGGQLQLGCRVGNLGRLPIVALI